MYWDEKRVNAGWREGLVLICCMNHGAEITVIKFHKLLLTETHWSSPQMDPINMFTRNRSKLKEWPDSKYLYVFKN
jgi:hypothetical protein